MTIPAHKLSSSTYHNDRKSDTAVLSSPSRHCLWDATKVADVLLWPVDFFECWHYGQYPDSNWMNTDK